MITFLIFIALYIVGIIGWFSLIYFSEKENIETIGDLLDNSNFLMYIPLINIGVLLTTLIIMGWVYFGIDELWQKFRNIKINKIK